MLVRARVHIAWSARVTYAVLVHMYICSHVPTRCSALGRTARQNSARPYYLRFVSWLQTITHFPGSSHLSPFSAGFIPPAQSPSVSFSLFLSRARPATLFHSLSSPGGGRLGSPSPRPHLPLHLHGHPFSSTPPLSFPFSIAFTLPLSAYGHVRTMQRSNGFVIELPSTANFILFWESADTHARARVRVRVHAKTKWNLSGCLSHVIVLPDVGKFFRD